MTDFLIVVESEHVVPIIGMVQFNVRSLLTNYGPTFSEEGPLDYFRLGTAPLAQADIGRILIESGMSLDFSTSSAIAYSASAYAFAFASSSDDPYAMAPGTSGISAIQRPSVSRSISKLNRTWRLLSLCGGFLFVMASKECPMGHLDAHYAGNGGRTHQNTPFCVVNPQVSILRPEHLLCRCRQCLVLKILRVNQLEHGVPKQERVLAIVKTPCHFVKVGWQVLCGDFMPRANDPALEQAEGRFDRVRVNVAVNVDLRAVLYGLVFLGWHRRLSHGERIGHIIIRHDHVYITADVFFDVAGQGARLRVLSMEESQIAATLPNTDDHLFGFLTSIDAPADLFSAYVGFVNFHRAIQLLKRLRFDHGVADSVAEVPRCAVVDSQHSLELICRHPFAGLAKKVRSKEPFGERKVRVMEDRASRDGELIAA
jgi:hypothetical protein